MTRTILELTVNVDRTGRRKEQIRWPQVDDRRNGDDGRRFGDMAVDEHAGKSSEQIAYEARIDPENQPFRPCPWADV